MEAMHGVQVCTINSDSKLTGAVDVFGCKALALELQTCSVFLSTTTANVYIKLCDSSTGTFRRLTYGGVYSAGATIANYEVPSTLGNEIIRIDEMGGFRYAKFEFSNTCTATATIRVHKIS